VFLVDAGFNVSRAADSLHATQSAVSKTITALEGDLGVSVFLRSSVRVAGLTEYGREFIDFARGILRDSEIAVIRAQEDARRVRGAFRIATQALTRPRCPGFRRTS
jgi:LysR family cys regulon transcriptional activator